MDNILKIADKRDATLPQGQVNARLGDDLLMRVGIPHPGGRLPAHASEGRYAAMVSASAFWNPRTRKFKFPDITPLMDMDWALDSAGFTAMWNWSRKGPQPGLATVFPWSYVDYLTLANLCGASWYSAPDLCVEPEIAASEEEVDYRIRATATLLEGCLRILYAWQNELVKTASTETVTQMIRPPVPVLQGWKVEHYQRSLDLLNAVWERWTPWLAPPALIGVGSVCRRDLNHPKHGLWAVLDGLNGDWPTGAGAHLFGVKGASLDKLRTMPWVASVDSMAWDRSAREKAHKGQYSNSLTHRCGEMTRWMRAAAERLQPAIDDRVPLRLAA